MHAFDKKSEDRIAVIISVRSHTIGKNVQLLYLENVR